MLELRSNSHVQRIQRKRGLDQDAEELLTTPLAARSSPLHHECSADGQEPWLTDHGSSCSTWKSNRSQVIAAAAASSAPAKAGRMWGERKGRDWKEQ